MFVFQLRSDFDGGTDTISGFTRGLDHIAMQGWGLDYVGRAAFSGEPEVRAEAAGRDRWMLRVDLDGDRHADLSILLAGATRPGEGDFLL